MAVRHVLKDKLAREGKDLMPTLTPFEVDRLASDAVSMLLKDQVEPIRLLGGIPRGGVSVGYLIAREIERRKPEWPTIHVDRADRGWTPDPALIIVDDIMDSGRTLRPYIEQGFKTLSLVVRTHSEPGVLPTAWGAKLKTVDWVGFPWDETSQSPEDAVVRLLEFLGRNPNDPDLIETPRRFLSWLNEFREGQEFPKITAFADHPKAYDQMIVVRDIPFMSLCEHHLMPFSGIACAAYIPEGEIIGLSKLARIVQYEAKRLSVQERLTHSILSLIKEATQSDHVGIVLKAEHTCMSNRGPRAQGHSTVTSALSGDFREDARTRDEFLRLSGL
jgi:GTP cyclohydrolase IA